MLFILVIFIVGLVRLVGTLLVRAVVITRKKGCGVWVFATVWGTLYQLVITPFRWADNTAEQMARDVEMKMTQESEEPFIYPRRKLDQARDEAKPLYKMAQSLFKKDGATSAPMGEVMGPV